MLAQASICRYADLRQPDQRHMPDAERVGTLFASKDVLRAVPNICMYITCRCWLKHLTGDIKRMLARIMAIDQNNYPEMLGHTCIINAPGVFKLVWSAIKGFIDPKTQEKIEASA